MTIQHAIAFVVIFLILVAMTAHNCNRMADVITNNTIWKG